MPRTQPTLKLQGVIRRLVRDRGFGFIGYRDARDVHQEVFFHRSALTNVRFEMLTEQDTVEFTINANAQKGPRAEEITKL